MAVHTINVLAAPQTPREMALEQERETAQGVGVFMPDPERPCVRWYGAWLLPTPDPAGFPQEFLSGLAGVEEHGLPVWPVTTRLDGETGAMVFYNAEDAVFWIEEPEGEYDPDWFFFCGWATPKRTRDPPSRAPTTK